MYLSRVQLDSARRETMRALEQPQRLHGAIERSFGQRQERLLWRIDRLRGQYYLLLVSREKPLFEALAAQFGFPQDAATWQIRDYEPFLNRLEQGQLWRFRLVANPVISLARKGKRGHVQALAGREAQLAWLQRQQARLGVRLTEDAYDILYSQWLKFGKQDGNVVSIRAITYEGLLEVVHAESLRESLTQGIGRGKAYGLGMMTLIPAAHT